MRSRLPLYLRATAAVLLAAFVLQDLSWALAERVSPSLTGPDPSALRVAPQFGRIESLRKGGRKLVIHVRDAHTNPGAQKNIAGLLTDFRKQKNIRTVYLEGGTRDDSLGHLTADVSEAARSRTAGKFLLAGELSGAEYLNLTDAPELSLQGVEDGALYRRNLKRYAEVAAQREKALAEIARIRSAVLSLKRRFYPADLLAMDEASRAFRRRNETFSGYFEKISQALAASGESAHGYPHLSDLGRLRETEQKVDFARAQKELAGKLARLNDGARPSMTLGKLKRGSPAELQFFESVLQSSEDPAPSLAAYVDYLRTFLRIDLERVLDEAEHFESRYVESRLESAEARRLQAADRHLERLEDLFGMRISRADFDRLQADSKDIRFRTVSILALVNRLFADLGRYSDLLEYRPEIDALRVPAETFYRENDLRDETMVRKMLAAMRAGGEETAVLVAGGWHTENLKRLLAENGFSYLVVSPNVEVETDSERYEKILFEGLTAPESDPKTSADAMNPLPFAERPGAGARLSAEIHSSQSPVQTAAPAESRAPRRSSLWGKAAATATVLAALLFPQEIRRPVKFDPQKSVQQVSEVPINEGPKHRLIMTVVFAEPVEIKPGEEIRVSWDSDQLLPNLRPDDLGTNTKLTDADGKEYGDYFPVIMPRGSRVEDGVVLSVAPTLKEPIKAVSLSTWIVTTDSDDPRVRLRSVEAGPATPKPKKAEPAKPAQKKGARLAGQSTRFSAASSMLLRLAVRQALISAAAAALAMILLAKNRDARGLLPDQSAVQAITLFWTFSAMIRMIAKVRASVLGHSNRSDTHDWPFPYLSLLMTIAWGGQVKEALAPVWPFIHHGLDSALMAIISGSFYGAVAGIIQKIYQKESGRADAEKEASDRENGARLSGTAQLTLRKSISSVLIVDDDPQTVAQIHEIFATAAKNLGISLRIHTASSASEALEIVKEHNVDLVHTDNEMPGERPRLHDEYDGPAGETLVRAIREYLLVTPVILSSSKSSFIKAGAEMDAEKLAANLNTIRIPKSVGREERLKHVESILRLSRESGVSDDDPEETAEDPGLLSQLGRLWPANRKSHSPPRREDWREYSHLKGILPEKALRHLRRQEFLRLEPAQAIALLELIFSSETTEKILRRADQMNTQRHSRVHHFWANEARDLIGDSIKSLPPDYADEIFRIIKTFTLMALRHADPSVRSLAFTTYWFLDPPFQQRLMNDPDIQDAFYESFVAAEKYGVFSPQTQVMNEMVSTMLQSGAQVEKIVQWAPGIAAKIKEYGVAYLDSGIQKTKESWALLNFVLLNPEPFFDPEVLEVFVRTQPNHGALLMTYILEVISEEMEKRGRSLPQEIYARFAGREKEMRRAVEWTEDVGPNRVAAFMKKVEAAGPSSEAPSEARSAGGARQAEGASASWKTWFVRGTFGVLIGSLAVFLPTMALSLYYAWVLRQPDLAMPFVPAARNSGMLSVFGAAAAYVILFARNTFQLTQTASLKLAGLAAVAIGFFSEFRNEGKFFLKTAVHFFGPGTWAQNFFNGLYDSLGTWLYTIEFSHWNDLLMGPAIVNVLFVVVFVKVVAAYRDLRPLSLSSAASAADDDDRLRQSLRIARIVMNVGLWWFFIQAWGEKGGFFRNPHSGDLMDFPFESGGALLGFWMIRILTEPFGKPMARYNSTLLVDFVVSGVIGLMYTLLINPFFEHTTETVSSSMASIPGALYDGQALGDPTAEEIARHRAWRPLELSVLGIVSWFMLNHLPQTEKLTRIGETYEDLPRWKKILTASGALLGLSAAYAGLVHALASIADSLFIYRAVVFAGIMTLAGFGADRLRKNTGMTSLNLEDRRSDNDSSGARLAKGELRRTGAAQLPRKILLREAAGEYEIRMYRKPSEFAALNRVEGREVSDNGAFHCNYILLDDAATGRMLLIHSNVRDQAAARDALSRGFELLGIQATAAADRPGIHAAIFRNPRWRPKSEAMSRAVQKAYVAALRDLGIDRVTVDIHQAWRQQVFADSRTGIFYSKDRYPRTIYVRAGGARLSASLAKGELRRAGAEGKIRMSRRRFLSFLASAPAAAQFHFSKNTAAAVVEVPVPAFSAVLSGFLTNERMDLYNRFSHWVSSSMSPYIDHGFDPNPGRTLNGLSFLLANEFHRFPDKGAPNLVPLPGELAPLLDFFFPGTRQPLLYPAVPGQPVSEAEAEWKRAQAARDANLDALRGMPVAREWFESAGEDRAKQRRLFEDLGIRVWRTYEHAGYYSQLVHKLRRFLPDSGIAETLGRMAAEGPDFLGDLEWFREWKDYYAAFDRASKAEELYRQARVRAKGDDLEKANHAKTAWEDARQELDRRRAAISAREDAWTLADQEALARWDGEGGYIPDSGARLSAWKQALVTGAALLAAIPLEVVSSFMRVKMFLHRAPQNLVWGWIPDLTIPFIFIQSFALTGAAFFWILGKLFKVDSQKEQRKWVGELHWISPLLYNALEIIGPILLKDAFFPGTSMPMLGSVFDPVDLAANWAAAGVSYTIHRKWGYLAASESSSGARLAVPQIVAEAWINHWVQKPDSKTWAEWAGDLSQVSESPLGQTRRRGTLTYYLDGYEYEWSVFGPLTGELLERFKHEKQKGTEPDLKTGWDVTLVKAVDAGTALNLTVRLSKEGEAAFERKFQLTPASKIRLKSKNAEKPPKDFLFMDTAPAITELARMVVEPPEHDWRKDSVRVESLKGLSIGTSDNNSERYFMPAGHPGYTYTWKSGPANTEGIVEDAFVIGNTPTLYVRYGGKGPLNSLQLNSRGRALARRYGRDTGPRLEVWGIDRNPHLAAPLAERRKIAEAAERAEKALAAQTPAPRRVPALPSNKAPPATGKTSGPKPAASQGGNTVMDPAIAALLSQTIHRIRLKDGREGLLKTAPAGLGKASVLFPGMGTEIIPTNQIDGYQPLMGTGWKPFKGARLAGGAGNGLWESIKKDQRIFYTNHFLNAVGSFLSRAAAMHVGSPFFIMALAWAGPAAFFAAFYRLTRGLEQKPFFNFEGWGLALRYASVIGAGIFAQASLFQAQALLDPVTMSFILLLYPALTWMFGKGILKEEVGFGRVQFGYLLMLSSALVKLYSSKLAMGAVQIHALAEGALWTVGAAVGAAWFAAGQHVFTRKHLEQFPEDPDPAPDPVKISIAASVSNTLFAVLMLALGLDGWNLVAQNMSLSPAVVLGFSVTVILFNTIQAPIRIENTRRSNAKNHLTKFSTSSFFAQPAHAFVNFIGWWLVVRLFGVDNPQSWPFVPTRLLDFASLAIGAVALPFILLPEDDYQGAKRSLKEFIGTYAKALKRLPDDTPQTLMTLIDAENAPKRADPGAEREVDWDSADDSSRGARLSSMLENYEALQESNASLEHAAEALARNDADEARKMAVRSLTILRGFDKPDWAAGYRAQRLWDVLEPFGETGQFDYDLAGTLRLISAASSLDGPWLAQKLGLSPLFTGRLGREELEPLGAWGVRPSGRPAEPYWQTYPHLGSGLFFDVYDLGDFVFKRPRPEAGGVLPLSENERRRIIEHIHRSLQQMIDDGFTVPSVRGDTDGGLWQQKASGLVVPELVRIFGENSREDRNARNNYRALVWNATRIYSHDNLIFDAGYWNSTYLETGRPFQWFDPILPFDDAIIAEVERRRGIDDFLTTQGLRRFGAGARQAAVSEARQGLTALERVHEALARTYHASMHDIDRNLTPDGSMDVSPLAVAWLRSDVKRGIPTALVTRRTEAESEPVVRQILEGVAPVDRQFLFLFSENAKWVSGFDRRGNPFRENLEHLYGVQAAKEMARLYFEERFDLHRDEIVTTGDKAAPKGDDHAFTSHRGGFSTHEFDPDAAHQNSLLSAWDLKGLEAWLRLREEINIEPRLARPPTFLDFLSSLAADLESRPLHVLLTDRHRLTEFERLDLDAYLGERETPMATDALSRLVGYGLESEGRFRTLLELLLNPVFVEEALKNPSEKIDWENHFGDAELRANGQALLASPEAMAAFRRVASHEALRRLFVAAYSASRVRLADSFVITENEAVGLIQPVSPEDRTVRYYPLYPMADAREMRALLRPVIERLGWYLEAPGDALSEREISRSVDAQRESESRERFTAFVRQGVPDGVPVAVHWKHYVTDADFEARNPLFELTSAYKFESAEAKKQMAHGLTALIRSRVGAEIAAAPGEWVMVSSSPYKLYETVVYDVARQAAGELGLPFVVLRDFSGANDTFNLRKVYSRLNTAAEREARLRLENEAIRLDAPDSAVAGKKVIYVDDVLNTGTTVKLALEKLSRRYGAAGLHVFGMIRADISTPSLEWRLADYLIWSRQWNKLGAVMNETLTAGGVQKNRRALTLLFGDPTVRFDWLVSFLELPALLELRTLAAAYLPLNDQVREKLSHLEQRIAIRQREETALYGARGARLAERPVSAVTYELLVDGQIQSPLFEHKGHLYVTFIVRGDPNRIGLEIGSDGSVSDVLLDPDDSDAADYQQLTGSKRLMRLEELRSHMTAEMYQRLSVYLNLANASAAQNRILEMIGQLPAEQPSLSPPVASKPEKPTISVTRKPEPAPLSPIRPPLAKKPAPPVIVPPKAIPATATVASETASAAEILPAGYAESLLSVVAGGVQRSFRSLRHYHKKNPSGNARYALYLSSGGFPNYIIQLRENEKKRIKAKDADFKFRIDWESGRIFGAEAGDNTRVLSGEQKKEIIRLLDSIKLSVGYDASVARKKTDGARLTESLKVLDLRTGQMTTLRYVRGGDLSETDRKNVAGALQEKWKVETLQYGWMLSDVLKWLSYNSPELKEMRFAMAPDGNVEGYARVVEHWMHDPYFLSDPAPPWWLASVGGGVIETHPDNRGTTGRYRGVGEALFIAELNEYPVDSKQSYVAHVKIRSARFEGLIRSALGRFQRDMGLTREDIARLTRYQNERLAEWEKMYAPAYAGGRLVSAQGAHVSASPDEQPLQFDLDRSLVSKRMWSLPYWNEKLHPFRRFADSEEIVSFELPGADGVWVPLIDRLDQIVVARFRDISKKPAIHPTHARFYFRLNPLPENGRATLLDIHLENRGLRHANLVYHPGKSAADESEVLPVGLPVVTSGTGKIEPKHLVAMMRSALGLSKLLSLYRNRLMTGRDTAVMLVEHDPKNPTRGVFETFLVPASAAQGRRQIEFERDSYGNVPDLIAFVGDVSKRNDGALIAEFGIHSSEVVFKFAEGYRKFRRYFLPADMRRLNPSRPLVLYLDEFYKRAGMKMKPRTQELKKARYVPPDASTFQMDAMQMVSSLIQDADLRKASFETLMKAQRVINGMAQEFARTGEKLPPHIVFYLGASVRDTRNGMLVPARIVFYRHAIGEYVPQEFETAGRKFIVRSRGEAAGTEGGFTVKESVSAPGRFPPLEETLRQAAGVLRSGRYRSRGISAAGARLAEDGFDKTSSDESSLIAFPELFEMTGLREMTVSPDVYPRFEGELYEDDLGQSVEFARAVASEAARAALPARPRLLDIGAGNGLASLAVLRALSSKPDFPIAAVKLDAIDLLNEAVHDTRVNLAAQSRAVPQLKRARVRVAQSEITRPFKGLAGKYDLIFFNSPAVSSSFKPDHIITTDPQNFMTLLTGALERLSPAGRLLIEIDDKNLPLEELTTKGFEISPSPLTGHRRLFVIHRAGARLAAVSGAPAKSDSTRELRVEAATTDHRTEVVFHFVVRAGDRERELMALQQRILENLDAHKAVLNARLHPFSFALKRDIGLAERIRMELRSERNGASASLSDPLNNALDGLKARAQRDGKPFEADLWFAVTYREGRAEFSIEDNGTGISTGFLRQFFLGYQSWKSETPGDFIGRSGEGISNYGYGVFRGLGGYLKIETRALDEERPMQLSIDFQKPFESIRETLQVNEGSRENFGTSVVWVLPGARLATRRGEPVQKSPRLVDESAAISGGLAAVSTPANGQQPILAKLIVNQHLFYEPEPNLKPGRLYKDGEELKSIGRGGNSTIFENGDSAIRIRRKTQHYFEYQETKMFDELGRSGQTPKLLSVGRTQNGFYYTEVERVFGESLDKIGRALSDEELNEVTLLIGSLIMSGMSLAEPTGSAVMVGHTAGNPVKKPYVTDPETIVEFESPQEAAESAFRSLYQWHFIGWNKADPRNRLAPLLKEYLESQGLNLGQAQGARLASVSMPANPAWGREVFGYQDFTDDDVLRGEPVERNAPTLPRDRVHYERPMPRFGPLLAPAEELQVDLYREEPAGARLVSVYEMQPKPIMIMTPLMKAADRILALFGSEPPKSTYSPEEKKRYIAAAAEFLNLFRNRPGALRSFSDEDHADASLVQFMPSSGDALLKPQNKQALLAAAKFSFKNMDLRQASRSTERTKLLSSLVFPKLAIDELDYADHIKRELFEIAAALVLLRRNVSTNSFSLDGDDIAEILTDMIRNGIIDESFRDEVLGRLEAEESGENAVEGEASTMRRAVELYIDTYFPDGSAEDKKRYAADLMLIFHHEAVRKMRESLQETGMAHLARAGQGSFDYSPDYPYDIRPVKKRLMSTRWAVQLEAVRRHLQSRGLTGGVLNSRLTSSDLATALLATDADTLHFYDMVPFGTVEDAKKSEEFKDMYFAVKAGSGYMWSNLVEAINNARAPIFWELEALGASKIKIVPGANPKETTVEFAWNATGEKPRLRKLIFHEREFANTNDFEGVFREGDRFYLHKAAMNIDLPHQAMPPVVLTFSDIDLREQGYEKIPFGSLPGHLTDTADEDRTYVSLGAGALWIKAETAGARLAQTNSADLFLKIAQANRSRISRDDVFYPVAFTAAHPMPIFGARFAAGPGGAIGLEMVTMNAAQIAVFDGTMPARTAFKSHWTRDEILNRARSQSAPALSKPITEPFPAAWFPQIAAIEKTDHAALLVDADGVWKDGRLASRRELDRILQILNLSLQYHGKTSDNLKIVFYGSVADTAEARRITDSLKRVSSKIDLLFVNTNGLTMGEGGLPEAVTRYLNDRNHSITKTLGLVYSQLWEPALGTPRKMAYVKTDNTSLSSILLALTLGPDGQTAHLPKQILSLIAREIQVAGRKVFVLLPPADAIDWDLFLDGLARRTVQTSA